MPFRTCIPKEVESFGSSGAAVTLALCWVVKNDAGSGGEEGLSAQERRLCSLLVLKSK